MVKRKFLRRGWYRYSKLGKRRKNKQKWRNPTGRHNKLRGKKRGYSATVSIGYSTQKSEREKLDGKTPIMVNNLNELKKIKRGEIALLGKIGKKNKMEIAKYAKENKIEIHNLNATKFLKKLETKK